MARYRQNVCIIVRKPSNGLLLVCHRKGFPLGKGWQFPQGGLHKGQDLISEARRELREEIGTDEISVIRVLPKRYVYEFPAGVKRRHGNFSGQAQQWILVDFLQGDEAINFDRQPAEFDSFEWVTPGTVLDRIVDFKKKVYTEAMKDMELSSQRQLKNTQ
jgi:putative (di)nucleoside polyphosphate hydrolase